MKFRSKLTASNLLHSLGLSYLICKQFGTGLLNGAKYLHESLPRLLTVWMQSGTIISDLSPGENVEECMAKFNQLARFIRRLTERLPAYQFLSSLPQLISRITHKQPLIHQGVELMILKTLSGYPQQTIWHLMSVSRSKIALRATRLQSILSKSKSEIRVSTIIQVSKTN